MQNKALYTVNRHACYILKYHLVVVTKYRHQVINDKVSDSLKQIATDIFESKWKCKIINFKSCGDHFHILFESSPQTQLSKLINNFKTVSSRLIRKQYAEYLKPYYWKPYFWSDSYYIGAVSDTTEEVVSKYITNQNKKG